MDNGLSDGSTRSWLSQREERDEQGKCALDAPIDRGLTATEAYTPSGGYASLLRKFHEMPRQTARSVVWAAVLTAATGGVVAALWADGYRFPPLWAMVVLGAFAVVAERQGVAISDRTQMSVSFLPLVFGAVVFGPLGGLVVGAISNMWDIRESRLKWAVYTPIRALTAAASGAAAWTFIPHASNLRRVLARVCLLASVVDLVAESVLFGATALVRGLNAVSELLNVASRLVSEAVPFYTSRCWRCWCSRTTLTHTRWVSR